MDFDNKFVKEKLALHYGDKRNLERELHITPIYNNHDTLGNIIFSLDGSPPKGYAIFEIKSPHNRGELWLYDAGGKRFKIYRGADYLEPKFLANQYQIDWDVIEAYKKKLKKEKENIGLS